MFAVRGTPVLAPASGTVEHRYNSLGGNSFHLWGDDGTYYCYSTHLDAYGPVQGWVDAGTVVGYDGDTGSAAEPVRTPTSRSTQAESLASPLLLSAGRWKLSRSARVGLTARPDSADRGHVARWNLSRDGTSPGD